MKKGIRALIAGIALAAIALTSTQAHAAGMKVGATVWYSWWDSTFLEKFISYKISPYTIKGTYSMNSAPLYGPILAFDFDNDLSLNVVFTCGSHFKAEGSAFTISPLGPNKTEAPVYKYDLDTTLTYSINKFFKVFAGMKVQGYNYRATYEAVSPNSPVSITKSKNRDFDFINYGPGLGISVTAPLGKSFFMLANASGLYLRSRYYYYDRNYQYLFDGSSPLPFLVTSSTLNGDLNAFGVNTGLSFAHIFIDPSITIAVGGRYQFLQHHMVNVSNTQRDLSNIDPMQNIRNNIIRGFMYEWGMNKELKKSQEHFYGLTLSVIYSIDFSAGKKEQG